MPLDDTEGRVAVVTGAGSGIGRAMVEHWVACGMSVAAADIDEAAVQATVATAGGDTLAVPVDVADPGSVERLADIVYDRWDAVHLLCNNAGVFQGGLSWDRPLADWEWTLGVNLRGLIHGAKSFVPRMLDGGDEGHVVNTSSVAGFVAAPMSGPYNVSKVAALSFTESLAHDLAAVGARIGASVLCPSAIHTGIAHTDRVRPDRSPDDPTAEDDVAAGVRRGLAAMVAEGIDPAEVPPIVLAGIRAGDFLIPTKPSYRDQLEVRFAALLERRLPPVPPIID